MNSSDYEKILNVMPQTGVYVIQEDDHRILYYNRRIEQTCPKIHQGMVCHDMWAGSCGNCPLLSSKITQENRSIGYNPLFGGVVDIIAARTLWNDTVAAFVITVTPRAAASTYRKLLKVDLERDCYGILKADSDVLPPDSEGAAFSVQLDHFVKSGVIHPEDVARFTEFTCLKRLRDALHKGTEALTCVYRRKYTDGFQWHLLEIVPAFDYTDDNPTAIFCIRNVHDIPGEKSENGVTVYPLKQDITVKNEQETLQLQAALDRIYIISSLSSLFLSTYYIDLEQDTFRVVSQLTKVEDVLGNKVNCTVALQIYANNFIHSDDQKKFRKVMNIQNWRDTLRWWNPFVTIDYRKISENSDTGPEEYFWVRATAILAQTGPDDLPKTVVYVVQNITEIQSQKR